MTGRKEPARKTFNCLELGPAPRRTGVSNVGGGVGAGEGERGKQNREVSSRLREAGGEQLP